MARGPKIIDYSRNMHRVRTDGKSIVQLRLKYTKTVGNSYEIGSI